MGVWATGPDVQERFSFVTFFCYWGYANSYNFVPSPSNKPRKHRVRNFFLFNKWFWLTWVINECPICSYRISGHYSLFLFVCFLLFFICLFFVRYYMSGEERYKNFLVSWMQVLYPIFLRYSSHILQTFFIGHIIFSALSIFL